MPPLGRASVDQQASEVVQQARARARRQPVPPALPPQSASVANPFRPPGASAPFSQAPPRRPSQPVVHLALELPVPVFVTQKLETFCDLVADEQIAGRLLLRELQVGEASADQYRGITQAAGRWFCGYCPLRRRAYR